MPETFLPVFFTTFALVGVYLACVFSLTLRLKSARMKARGYDGPDPFSFFGSMLFLGWAFSGKHRVLNDGWVTRLTWATRCLFTILIPLYVFIFLQVLPVF